MTKTGYCGVVGQLLVHNTDFSLPATLVIAIFLSRLARDMDHLIWRQFQLEHMNQGKLAHFQTFLIFEISNKTEYLFSFLELFHRGLMQFQHVNPQEAVEVHEDIQSNFSLGIHWGTFNLSYEVRTFLINRKLPNKHFCQACTYTKMLCTSKDYPSFLQ